MLSPIGVRSDRGESRRGVYLVQSVAPANDRASAMLDAASEISAGLAQRRAERPNVRRKRPMSADPLSDVLKTVRLTGAIFFDVTANAPWVAEQPPREMILPRILPGAEHLIAYHVVTEGRVFANIIGGNRSWSKPAKSSSSPMAIRTSCRAAPGLRADPGHPGGRQGGDRRTVAVLRQLWRRRSGGQAGLRLPRLRCAAVQSAPREPAAGDQGRRSGSDQTGWLGQFARFAMMETS